METRMTATITKTAPRVWVGCIGCYPAGSLTGDWVDATEVDDADALSDAVTAYRPDGTCAKCGSEEWESFDHEGMHGVSETNLSLIAVIARAMEESDHPQAFAAWLDHMGYAAHELTDDADARLEEFREMFEGEWESDLKFAQDSDVLCTDSWPRTAVDHFDWDSYTNMLFVNDYWSHGVKHPTYAFVASVLVFRTH
jgi:antirestriction protein